MLSPVSFFSWRKPVSPWPPPRRTISSRRRKAGTSGKNYTAALESYDAFAAAYPLSERIADVQYRRVVCLYRLDRYRDAVQLIGEIEVRYRTTRYFSFVPLWKGLSLYGLKSYSLCIDSLDEFLAGPADAEFTPQALLHKALAQTALSNDDGARDTLRLLTSGYQSSRLFPYASVLLGSLLQRQRSFADLLAFTQKTDPTSFPEPWKSDFLLLRAEALWQSGRADDAQPLYIQLVGAPDDVALVAYGRLFAAAQRRKDLPGMQDLTQAAEARFAGPHRGAVGAVDAGRRGDLPPGRPRLRGAVPPPRMERAQGSCRSTRSCRCTSRRSFAPARTPRGHGRFSWISSAPESPAPAPRSSASATSP